MSEILVCDVCGFAHENNVNAYPDKVLRCVVCASKASHGRYVSIQEVALMNASEMAAHQKRYFVWCTSLTEDTDHEKSN